MGTLKRVGYFPKATPRERRGKWALFLTIFFLFISLSLFLGEGFHNYHHTFPFDYSTSEYGWRWNVTTSFIDLMCFLGLASDCKKVAKDTILARKIRTGDGSHKTGWKIGFPWPLFSPFFQQPSRIFDLFTSYLGLCKAWNGRGLCKVHWHKWNI